MYIIKFSRNPILLKVLAERQKMYECLMQRPKEFIPSARPSRTYITDTLKLDTYGGSLYENPSLASQHTFKMERRETFAYNASEFDEKEFLEHIYIPGPRNRYYYLKNLRE